MRVRITHVLERIIDLDVEAEDEATAVTTGLLVASDIQSADWDYTWKPTHEEARVITGKSTT